MDTSADPSMQDPIMGGANPMGGDSNAMGGEEPMNGDPNAMGGEEPMDDGFDAGVDVNPEEDPKKYLQQLTGKLSQELRNYNQDQQKPDTELNKYIAGMIIPQATKDMTDKEKKEVINKIESNSADEEEGGIGDDFIGQDEQPQDDMQPQDNMQPQGNEMPMESKKSLNKIINEIINSFNDDKQERKEKNLKIKNKRINPFVSNF